MRSQSVSCFLIFLKKAENFIIFWHYLKQEFTKIYVLFYFLRWPSRIIPNKYFSNLQIHFKPKNLYFKSRSISKMSIYILESSKHYLILITIIQIEKFIFEIKIYFSSLQNYNSNRL